MLELSISPNFTVEDIHKVREYNYEMTKNMATEERRSYYRAGASAAQKRFDELRLAGKQAQQQ